jgi:F0F1-type ATP synthase delta subunit
MKPKLPDSLYSVDQVLAVAEELHQYGRQVAGRGSKVDTKELSPAAADLLATLPAGQRDESPAIEELREGLEELAATAAVITLVLAASPSAQLKQELTSWLRTNVRPRLLVNFHVDPEIAGGIVIRSTNHIFDNSFRSALIANQAQFTKVLGRV